MKKTTQKGWGVSIQGIVLLFGIAVGVGIGGCEGHGAIDGAVALRAASLPIINGVEPDAARHNAVVAIRITTPRAIYLCSGSLITPEVVVTAAHCTDVETRPKPQFRTAAPTALKVYVGDDLGAALEHDVAEVVIHPDYNRLYLGRNDISLIRLSEPVPACGGDVAFPDCADPVAALPSARALNNGDIGAADALDFAGFGVTAVNGGAGVKMHVSGTLGGFGCAVFGCSAPGDPAIQFSYAQVFVNPDPEGEDGQGPCFGDSGGPTFIERDGVWYTAGVTSYGDSRCEVFGVSMRVDAYAGFIAEFIGDAGCATDTACDDGNLCTSDTCQSGACVNVPAPDDTVCDGGICCAGLCGAPYCEVDADCSDGDGCTVDTCIGGGACNAVCQIDWPACGLSDGCCGFICTPEDDPDCEGDPVATCGGNKAACTAADDCCGGQCVNGQCRGG